MLIDSHCHLNFKDFESDLDQVIEHAKQAGILGMLTVNTQLSEALEIQAIADRYKNVFCSVGIHPCEAKNHSYDDFERANQIKSFLNHPKVAALGETGLDYYYEMDSREVQISSFKTHLELAQEFDLPVIIHTRDANQDTIDSIKSVQNNNKNKTIRGVFHCFTGTQELAAQALDLGFYISFSGIVTFKNAKDLQEVATTIPMDRLLVETDAPYLAPNPHRGKRNEPAYTKHTAQFIADLRSIPYEELACQTTDNFFALFNKITPNDFL